MYNGIQSIDHPLIAVADMDASRQVYEDLGFNVPPRGSHIEWGTGNWCIMFKHDYLELRGILDPERYTLGLEHVLETYGEGLSGIAFGNEGAEISFKKMQDNGLNPKPVRYLSRNFEIPEGWLQPKFALCFPNDDEIDGLMHVVLCEHLTPELLRKPEYLIHSNGVQGILFATGIIEDFDTVEAKQTRLLGQEAIQRHDNDEIRLTTPSGQFIRLMSASQASKEYGDLMKVLPEQSSYLTTLGLEVDDLNKTVQVLNQNKIPYQQLNSQHLRVGAQYCCGVVLEFIQI